MRLPKIVYLRNGFLGKGKRLPRNVTASGKYYIMLRIQLTLQQPSGSL